jgi:hypothetical protein
MALLWTFAGAFEDVSPTINLYQTAAFLKKDLILAVGGAEEFFPTVAALVLFGKDERVQELFPRSVVTVSRYSGYNGSAQLVEKLELKGNLHSQNEAIIAFIERYCDLVKEKPKKSLHLVGSPGRGSCFLSRVCSSGSGCERAHPSGFCAPRHPDADHYLRQLIEIVNARRTQGFVPPASRAIRYGITQRLNPQIASIFSRREYGTSVPRGGVPMILKQSGACRG